MEALKIMKDAWQAYKANSARLIIGTAVYFLILVLLTMFAFLPSLSVFVFSSDIGLFVSLSLFSLFVLIAIGVAGLFTHGYIQFVAQAFGPTLEHAKKDKVDADTKPGFLMILKSASDGKQMAGLFYACTAALVVIFGLPYFYAGSTAIMLLALPFAAVFLFFTSLAPCLVSFRKTPPLEAWGESFELAVTHFKAWLTMTVILTILTLILLVIPIVGPVILFVLVPWFVLSKIGFYNNI